VKSYRQTWRIQPAPGGSQFTFSEEVELPNGFLGKLPGFIMEPISAGTVDKMLIKLKSLAEA